MKEEAKNIAEEIRRKMKILGISQANIGHFLCIDQSLISRTLSSYDLNKLYALERTVLEYEVWRFKRAFGEDEVIKRLKDEIEKAA